MCVCVYSFLLKSVCFIFVGAHFFLEILILSWTSSFLTIGKRGPWQLLWINRMKLPQKREYGVSDAK